MNRTAGGIPRTFHRIWLGSDLPETAARWGETWTARNPGWELVTWTEDNLPPLENQDLFDHASAWAQKSDIARYEIIRRHGGVYLDTDFEALRPIEQLIDELDFFGVHQGGPVLTNSLFGATPEHPVLARCIDDLRASYLGRAGAGIPEQTGPEFFTRCVAAVPPADPERRRLFPPAFFFPYYPGELDQFDPSASRAYGVHHWGGADGWVGSDAPVAGGAWPIGAAARARLLPEVLRHRAEVARRATRSSARTRARTAIERARDRLTDLGLITRSQPTVYIGNGRLLTMTRQGIRLVLLADDLSLTPHLALTGDYEGNLSRFIVDRVRPGDVAVDVGANIGLFTTVLAKTVGPSGRVYAYECNSDVLDVLRDNVTMNGFDQTVTIVPKAAHAESGTISFAAPDALFGLGSPVIDREIGPASIRTVPSERIDEQIPDDVDIRLVKIDVEGGELGALLGMSRLIDEGRVGVVVLEFGYDRQDHVWAEMCALLESYERDHGATFGAIDEHGGIDAKPLDEVLLVADYGNLVIVFDADR